MNWWEQLDGPMLGRYRIERVLGEGGMARVFLATDLKSGRVVAIKSPKIESFPPDRVAELLKRFGREFQAQINEPILGVVPVFDADDVIDAQGVRRPILVMQYLTGGSLATRLGGRVGARERQQTLGEVLAWLQPIAGAIDALHRRKFLHRDIKPDNILFDADDRAFLADFGVVGLLDDTHDLASTIGSSMTAVSPGSPGYMSPESIKADPVSRNAPASDQFSLGIAVYEALSGRLPVPVGTTGEWYGALANWAPAPLAAVWPERSANAAAAVMRAISARPEDRFLTCSDFALALDVAARQVPLSEPVEQVAAVTPRKVSPPPVAANSTVRVVPSARKWLLAAVLVAVVAWVGARVLQDATTPDALDTIELASPVFASSDDDAPSAGDASAAAAPSAPVAAAQVASKTSSDPVAGDAEMDRMLDDLVEATTTPEERAEAACKGVDKDRDGVEDCLDFCTKEDPGYSPGKPVSPFGCKDSDWNVFWYSEPQRTTIDADDMAGALEKIRKAGGKRVGVYGSGSKLGRRRVGIVVDYLLSHGVDAERILEPAFRQATPSKPGSEALCGNDCAFDQVVQIAVEGSPGLLGPRS